MTDKGEFVVRYTNKDIMAKLELIHDAALITNGKVKFHTKLLWASFSFSFAILVIFIRHLSPS